MKCRVAEMSDLAQMMNIVHQAQEDLKEMGVQQWQNGYPNETVLCDDILKKKAIVIADEQVFGFMVVSMNDEVTYDPLTTWVKDEYLVLHRFAVDRTVQRQGIASQMIDAAKQMAYQHQIGSIRIDTHEKNVKMRRFLEKNHFEERGIIFLKDGSPRIAYELLFDARV